MGTDVVYKLFYQPATWYTARDVCQSQGDGVTLARIFCYNERYWLFSQGRDYADNSPLWIGGNDINNEGTWVWTDSDGSDGIAIESTGGWDIPWNTNQPDNAQGIEDCLEVNRFGINFNDYPCGQMLNGFLCEKRFYD